MEDDDDVLERDLFKQMQRRIFGEAAHKKTNAPKIEYTLRGKYKIKKHKIQIKLKIKQDG